MQGRELKMTNDVKESFTNIRRPDQNQVTKEKSLELNFSHTNGSNRFVSTNIISNSITNRSHPTLIHEVENLNSNIKRIESFEKIENSKASDLHSHTSDLNSFCGDVKNYLNFFSLPMYGLCEKSTQTELTGRDIEDLEYFRREFSTSMNCLSRNNNKDKSEFKNRLFPFLEDNKISYSLSFTNLNNSQTEIPNTKIEKNFIQIKRKSDAEEKTVKTRTSVVNTTPNLHLHNHIHLKNRRQNQTKRKKKEEINTELTQSSKEEDTFSLQRNNSNTKLIESSPFKLISTKKSMNMLNIINEVVEDVKCSNSQLSQSNSNQTEIRNETQDNNLQKRDFNDSEFNISEIINDIKNSTRKEINYSDSQNLQKKESNNFARETSINQIQYELTNGNLANTIATTEDSLTGKASHTAKSTVKNKAKKFDAYYFFKNEFALSKPNMDEAELEKLCRKEWNLLDKDTKKIYNINAEREKKIQKLNKKNLMKEQMQKVDEGIR